MSHFRFNKPQSKYQVIEQALIVHKNLTGQEFKLGRNLTSKNLEAGMKVVAYYNSTNQGCDIVEILGFTGHEVQYGAGGVEFKTAKEVYREYNVNSLRELETLCSETFEYGHHPYIQARDLHSKEEGPWYYPFEGRWSRGSGAESLSFIELIPTDDEEYVKYTLEKSTKPNRVFLAIDEE